MPVAASTCRSRGLLLGSGPFDSLRSLRGRYGASRGRSRRALRGRYGGRYRALGRRHPHVRLLELEAHPVAQLQSRHVLGGELKTTRTIDDRELLCDGMLAVVAVTAE